MFGLTLLLQTTYYWLFQFIFIFFFLSWVFHSNSNPNSKHNAFSRMFLQVRSTTCSSTTCWNMYFFSLEICRRNYEKTIHEKTSIKKNDVYIFLLLLLNISVIQNKKRRRNLSILWLDRILVWVDCFEFLRSFWLAGVK